MSKGRYILTVFPLENKIVPRLWLPFNRCETKALGKFNDYLNFNTPIEDKVAKRHKLITNNVICQWSSH